MKSKSLFKDPEYQINANELSRLDSRTDKVILKRLYDMYRQFPIDDRPSFFPKNERTATRVKNHI